ncbi:MAG: ATP-dependent RNA helicase [Spirochaetales bacterium]|nr:ATP-dependent RNA helicase [Spirochaetales bacterium]
MNSKKLPVYKQRSKILKRLASNQVIVVESPTGSGKTTQIPQILYEARYAKSGIIGITQPRRIAAVSVAQFIAKQMGKTIPDTVGYKMRFEDATDARTKIKIMTDGILLQEIKADYMLSKYSVIIVDEAHERSLNIDFIIGLLKRILQSRPNFKVIISSATINAQVFSEYFDSCPVVNIESIIYPVKIVYQVAKVEHNFDMMLQNITDIMFRIDKESEEGDVLVFLSGEKGIKQCITMLYGLPFADKLEILPLYSRLSSEEQEKVFNQYPGKRKVIVATNIAETSVTIDGIIYVIDSGLAKMNFYNPRTFTSSLVEVPISKAACNQRKGRAGRTNPGVCFRLYNHTDYESRSMFTLEEIFRTDLSEVVLRMAEIGIHDFEGFDFISQPQKEGIHSAVETLTMLDGLDDNMELTEIGKMMAIFPLLPRHSRIIVEAIMRYPVVIEEVLIATAFLTTNSPFLLPQGLEIEARKAHHSFRDKNGDFLSYLKLYKSFLRTNRKEKFCEQYFLDYKTMLEILNIKTQLEDIVAENKIPIRSGGGVKDYISAIARGLIQFVCIKRGKELYASLTAEKIFIHPGSVMFRKNPRFIVAGEIVKTTRTYARSVSEILPEWIPDISPLLTSLLGVEGGVKRKRRGERDYTNNIKIGGEVFRIETVKGKKKTVVLPWNKVKAMLPALTDAMMPSFKGLRGKIIYEQYEILSGTRLDTLLNLAAKINPEKEIIRKWPRNIFRFRENPARLLQNLRLILMLCKQRKKSKRLGFLSLRTDGEGNYRFICKKTFYSALTESLASLETLADEPDEVLQGPDRQTVNKLYRRLAGLLE